MNVAEAGLWTLFEAVASAVPDHEAVVWRDRRIDYRELRDRSQRFAAVLAAHAIGRHTSRRDLDGWQSGQDFVATYLLNGPEYLEVTLGGWAATAAPFNVNYRYVAAELAYLLDDAAAAAVVYHARFAKTLAEVLPRLRTPPRLLLQVADDSGCALLPGAVDYESALAGAAPSVCPETSPDDLYVLYTGGTTGMPKGTLWRQADIWVAALGGERFTLGPPEVAAAATRNAARGRGRFLATAPFMHGAAHWIALRQLLSGGTVIVCDTVDHFDASEAWSIVERERVDTIAVMGEAMARPLLAALETSDHDASSLFAVLLGGAPTSPATKERILARLPQALLVDGAGASETGGGLQSVSKQASVAEAAVFEAQPFVAVLDAERSGCLQPGADEVGWYAKRGHIPLGYLGDETKTMATFPVVDGTRWSVPGDRARWRADGRIELLGRDSVTINTGGEKVFAEEVEAAMLAHPAVADAVVVGRASERWGQEVVAVVALSDDTVTDADLLAGASELLARYKLPKAVIRVPVVVRSPAGKADYRWAKDVAESAEAPA